MVPERSFHVVDAGSFYGRLSFFNGHYLPLREVVFVRLVEHAKIHEIVGGLANFDESCGFVHEYVTGWLVDCLVEDVRKVK